MRLILFSVLLLVGCTMPGATNPTTTLQGAELVRGTLNGVYDSVVLLRAGCKEVPKASTCKLTDSEKSSVMVIADAIEAELQLVESGNATTAACLNVLNAGLAKADQPPIMTATSCLELATQVLSTLQIRLKVKQS